jgi:hypothetical protein
MVAPGVEGDVGAWLTAAAFKALSLLKRMDFKAMAVSVAAQSREDCWDPHDGRVL